MRRRLTLAHVFGWQLAYGPVPPGMKVCHHCDNPACQNSEHWFLGTQAQNVADRDRKGRQAPRDGERNGRHKLTRAQVDSIRVLHSGGVRQVDLARRFQVSSQTINHVIRERRWVP